MQLFQIICFLIKSSSSKHLSESKSLCVTRHGYTVHQINSNMRLSIGIKSGTIRKAKFIGYSYLDASTELILVETGIQ